MKMAIHIKVLNLILWLDLRTRGQWMTVCRSILHQVFVGWFIWSFFNAYRVQIYLEKTCSPSCFRNLLFILLCSIFLINNSIESLFSTTKSTFEIENVVLDRRERVVVWYINPCSFSLLRSFINIHYFRPFNWRFSNCWLEGSPASTMTRCSYCLWSTFRFSYCFSFALFLAFNLIWARNCHCLV